MLWRVLFVVSGLFFLVNGCQILIEEDCNSVDIGGTRRVISYTCHDSSGEGELSGGTAGGLGVAIGLGMILIAIAPALRNFSDSVSYETRNVRWINLLKGYWNTRRVHRSNFDFSRAPPTLEDIDAQEVKTEKEKKAWAKVCGDCFIQLDSKSEARQKCGNCGGKTYSINHFVCSNCGASSREERFSSLKFTYYQEDPIEWREDGSCNDCGSEEFFLCGSGGQFIYEDKPPHRIERNRWTGCTKCKVLPEKREESKYKDFEIYTDYDGKCVEWKKKQSSKTN